MWWGETQIYRTYVCKVGMIADFTSHFDPHRKQRIGEIVHNIGSGCTSFVIEQSISPPHLNNTSGPCAKENEGVSFVIEV